MCGIAGIVDLTGQKVDIRVIDQMVDAIRHRGPNDRGAWAEKNVGFGHARLSIVDVSPKAAQPMETNDFSGCLIYNGEIYNYAELRRELNQVGAIFKSESDTEVLLYALKHWGTSAIKKLNGMFAFAYFDRIKNRIIIARDRYGVKPLYIANQNNRLYFGSEQKAFTTLPCFNRFLNKEALIEYFTFQNFLSDQTLFKNVELLKPGHFTVICLNTGSITTSQYWDFNFQQSRSQLDYNEYKSELAFLFKQAVERQLIGDVEIAAYLSGGMDSGSISAVASKRNEGFKSFTVGFESSTASGIEFGFDERAQAELMSAFFKTEHYQMVLKSGDLERCFKDLVYHLEEPRVGQSYPNFYAAKLASKFVKVVLSGAGGDELFAGYPWRYYANSASLTFEEFIDSYYNYWQRLLPNKEIKKVFQPIKHEAKNVWTRDIFENVFCEKEIGDGDPSDFINKSLYFEAKTFMQGLLIVEDKLSMAHGLEARVPFLDNDLVDFATSCPIEFKLDSMSGHARIDENTKNKKMEYFEKTNRGKKILREAMKSFIPKQILERPKQGFSAPDASWFKGESIEFVRNKLYRSDANIFAFMDRPSIINLLDEHLSGAKNRRLLIWSLLYFEEWIEQNL